MTFGDTVRDFVERVLDNIGISSASPDFTNYVKEINPVSPSFLDDTFRSEVVRVIQEEIKIQLTEVREKETGIGSDEIVAGTNAESKVKSTILKGFGATKNPLGAVTAAVGNIPIPHAALVALALALIPLIFKELTRDGGGLDLRWKRIIDREVNGFLDRQTQRNTQIGLRQVIIQSRAGFIQKNGGAGNENTIRQIRDGGVDGNRLAQIDILDHSKELFQ